MRYWSVRVVACATERKMAYRPLENGDRPSVDLTEGTEARLALETLVDSAGLTNIVLALARFTSDRSEDLRQQDPVMAECWLESSRALFRCGVKVDSLWPHSAESRSVRRAATAERVGAQLADTVKRWLK